MSTATTKRPTPNVMPQRAAAIKRRVVAAAPSEPAPIPTAVRQIDVTPALAAGWLLRNTRNRSVRLETVAAMSRDMQQGRWVYTGGTIGFDTNGVLIDGQHRLLALVELGTTQRFVVVPNLAPEAMTVVDTGAKRTTADVIALTDPDMPSPTLTAAVLRIGVAMERGRLASNDLKSTNGEMLEWLNRNKNILGYVRLVNSGSSHYKPAAPAVVAWCWWRLAAIDAFDANAFFEDWREVRTSGSGDPLNALIKRLASAKDGRERLLRPTMVALVFRAWNARRSGESLRRMMISSSNGLIDIPEPK